MNIWINYFHLHWVFLRCTCKNTKAGNVVKVTAKSSAMFQPHGVILPFKMSWNVFVLLLVDQLCKLISDAPKHILKTKYHVVELDCSNIFHIIHFIHGLELGWRCHWVTFSCCECDNMNLKYAIIQMRVCDGLLRWRPPNLGFYGHNVSLEGHAPDPP